MSENIVLEAMKNRRSIRKFQSVLPPEDLVRQVMEAGSYAASSMGRQSAVIVEVKDPAVRDRLSEVNRMIGGWDASFDPFYGAPVCLIVLAPKAEANRVYDGSLVMGNLMLAAHALGLGSCWIHRAKEEFETGEWKAFLRSLGVEGDYEGVGHCVLGYPAGALPEPPARKPGRVFWAE